MIIASNQSSAATTKPIPVAAKQWSQSIAIAAAISSASYALGVLPWYLSQFPARLTLDSADQLLQALGRRPLDNSHPVAVTLLLRTVNSDPGLYVFLQYLFVSLAFGAVFGLASHGFSTRPRPAPLWSMAIIAFACGIAPQSGSFVPYVIKDVPFAAVAMLAAAAFAICLNDRRLTFATGAAIGALSTLPWFLRHEALIFTFVITLMACVVSLRWRPRPIGWMIGFLSALLLMVAFRSVLPKLVGSTPGSGGWAYSAAFVHDISGIMYLDPIDARDEKFIRNFIEPRKLRESFRWERVDLAHENRLLDLEWLGTHKIEFARGYFRIALRHLPSLVMVRIRRVLYQIGIGWLDTFAGRDNPRQYIYVPVRPIALGNIARDFLEWTYQVEPARLVVWCSLWPLVLLLFIGVVADPRSPGIAAFVFAPLGNAVLFSVVSHANTFRYNYYIFPFSLAALLAFISQRLELRLSHPHQAPPEPYTPVRPREAS